MALEALKSLSGPVLITGHTGFKGTWLSILLDRLGINHFGFSLPPQPDSLFQRIKTKEAKLGMIGDVRNLDQLQKCFELVKPSVVIHLAAQSLVLDSYNNPLDTFQINSLGTANVLDASFTHSSIKSILVVTTDKVYQNDETGKPFKESDRLGGKDPYSASKVAAEFISASYQNLAETLGGPRVLIARAGNVVGGGDFARNRLLPDIIRAVARKESMVVRNPNSTRPWQHVLDPLLAYLKYIDKSLEHGESVPALNFSPKERSLTVREVVESASQFFGEDFQIKLDRNNLALESRSLELDSSLASKWMGWSPLLNQKEALSATFSWWREVLYKQKDPLQLCKDEIEVLLGRLDRS